MNTDGIDAALGPLAQARDYMGGQIARLALLAIAQLSREALPGAAAIQLYRDAQGDMAPGTFYDADGADLYTEARAVNRSDARRAAMAGMDQLTDRIRPYCAWLDAANAGTWLDLVSDCDPSGQLLPDGDKRLYVALILGLAVQAAPGPVIAAGIVEVIDARHGARPHRCAGAWAYAGLNDGGHQVFTCSSGHRLIASHPAGGHQCDAACAEARIPD